MTTLREKMKQEMTLRGFSLSTQEHYLKAVIKLHDHFNCNPAKLTEDDIKSFLSTIANSTLSTSTYNVIICGLKFFYRTVLDKPIIAIRLPLKREPQKLPDILSPSEVQRIIKATSNLKYRTIFIVVYGAGLRVSEAASLRINDLDRSRSVIHIRAGKGSKDRYVTLSPMMLSALELYWKTCRLTQFSRDAKTNNDFIFPGRKQALCTRSIRLVYEASKLKAGIKKRGGIHALRHAFATHALESGTDLFIIQQLLGHASVESTAHYLRMTDKARQLMEPPIEKLSF